MRLDPISLHHALLNESVRDSLLHAYISSSCLLASWLADGQKTRHRPEAQQTYGRLSHANRRVEEAPDAACAERSALLVVGGDAMSDLSKPSLGHRAIEEVKEMLALTAYLYVCLGSLMLLKSAILRDAGINFTIWGIAIVKALVLAKFMLLGNAANIGKRHKDKPLIWPTLYMSLMFLILLLVLTTIEELLVGAIHGRSLGDSLAHVVGPSLYVGLATCFVMFLILVPYCAFKSLGDVLGDQYLVRLFFVERLDKRESSRNK
jgi:hypothetical protein